MGRHRERVKNKACKNCQKNTGERNVPAKSQGSKNPTYATLLLLPSTESDSPTCFKRLLPTHRQSPICRMPHRCVESHCVKKLVGRATRAKDASSRRIWLRVKPHQNVQDGLNVQPISLSYPEATVQHLCYKLWQGPLAEDKVLMCQSSQYSPLRRWLFIIFLSIKC